MFDSGVIWRGKISCESLLGVKRLQLEATISSATLSKSVTHSDMHSVYDILQLFFLVFVVSLIEGQKKAKNKKNELKRPRVVNELRQEKIIGLYLLSTEETNTDR